MDPFVNLPDEIILAIANQITDHQSIHDFCRTSRRFDRVVCKDPHFVLGQWESTLRQHWYNPSSNLPIPLSTVVGASAKWNPYLTNQMLVRVFRTLDPIAVRRAITPLLHAVVISRSHRVFLFNREYWWIILKEVLTHLRINPIRQLIEQFNDLIMEWLNTDEFVVKEMRDFYQSLRLWGLGLKSLAARGTVSQFDQWLKVEYRTLDGTTALKMYDIAINRQNTLVASYLVDHYHESMLDTPELSVSNGLISGVPNIIHFHYLRLMKEPEGLIDLMDEILGLVSQHRFQVVDRIGVTLFSIIKDQYPSPDYFNIPNFTFDLSSIQYLRTSWLWNLIDNFSSQLATEILIDHLETRVLNVELINYLSNQWSITQDDLTVVRQYLIKLDLDIETKRTIEQFL